MTYHSDDRIVMPIVIKCAWRHYYYMRELYIARGYRGWLLWVPQYGEDPKAAVRQRVRLALARFQRHSLPADWVKLDFLG